MSSPENDEVVEKARADFVYRLIVWIWKRVIYILAVGNALSAVAVWFGPAASRNSVAFALMREINLPNSVIAGAFLIGAVLLMWQHTALWGHFISFLALGWWTFLITYIALFLQEPTSLISATWSLTLGALHLLVGVSRWMARSGYRKIRMEVKGIGNE